MANGLDYSKYTIEQLLEVKSHIKPDASPENYKNLLSELEKRKSQIEEYSKSEDREFTSANKKITKIIGYLQLTAPFFIVAVLILTFISSTTTPLWYIAISLCAIVLNACAGYTLLKGKTKYYWLSIFNQTLQIPKITIGSLLLKYSGIGGIFFGIEWRNSKFWDTVNLSFSPTLSPGFTFQNPFASSQSGSIEFDIIAIIFIFALIMVTGADLSTNPATTQGSREARDP